ncbi:hypothetical protein [Agrococcus sp. DT81.2]|uniref:hypothetical protein n=1 Tax=Agrococcus sp. DT81.2 TaxID=3393414 RepID=UPI003CE48F79
MLIVRHATALAAAAVSVAVLAACTSTAADSSVSEATSTTPPLSVAASTTPAPSATGITGTDVPEGYYVVDEGRAAVLGRSGEGCEGLPGLEPRSDESDEGIGGYWYSELRDIGPIDQATGEVTTDADGRPVAYVAAEGDTMYAIAQRFCIDYPGYLGQLNGIRRGDGSAHLFALQPDLWAGDTINLDPYAIATVGDQNGQVFEHAIDYRIPEQRP